MGFKTDSLHIAIEIIVEKKQKNLKMCTGAKLAHTFPIKELDKLVGNLIASIEAVPWDYIYIFYR